MRAPDPRRTRTPGRRRRTRTRSGKTSPDPALQLLGLAARAGAVAAGTERVRDAVRNDRARLVIVAADLTETGRAKLVPLLEHRGVRYVVRYARAELGGAVGKGPLAALGVTQDGFAERLGTLFASSDGVD